jgi:hypothetical protein
VTKKVTSLFRDYDAEANGTVINILKDAVKDAEEGNVINCAIILIDKDDTITYSYANNARKYTLIGAFEFLKNLIFELESDV